MQHELQIVWWVKANTGSVVYFDEVQAQTNSLMTDAERKWEERSICLNVSTLQSINTVKAGQYYHFWFLWTHLP